MTCVIVKGEKNGPFLIEVDEKTTLTLCRCGKSKTQPSCDGTHEKINFKADYSELKIIK